MIELCYFSLDQWEVRIHLLWGKCFNIPHNCDPHLNQTKFNDLLPLTINGVLASHWGFRCPPSPLLLEDNLREVHFCAPAASWLNVKGAFLSDYNHFLFNNARCGVFLSIFLEHLFRHLKLHLILSLPPHCKSGRTQVKLCPTSQLHQTLYISKLFVRYLVQIGNRACIFQSVHLMTYHPLVIFFQYWGNICSEYGAYADESGIGLTFVPCSSSTASSIIHFPLHLMRPVAGSPFRRLSSTEDQYGWI